MSYKIKKSKVKLKSKTRTITFMYKDNTSLSLNINTKPTVQEVKIDLKTGELDEKNGKPFKVLLNDIPMLKKHSFVEYGNKAFLNTSIDDEQTLINMDEVKKITLGKVMDVGEEIEYTYNTLEEVKPRQKTNK